MVDYRRMEWQFHANKIATRVLIGCVLLTAPEVMEAFRYHFPWWDDFALVFTTIVGAAARFVQKYTDISRIDL